MIVTKRSLRLHRLVADLRVRWMTRRYLWRMLHGDEWHSRHRAMRALHRIHEVRARMREKS